MWEWSHTPEAYANARLNLNDLKTDELQEIFSEWWAYWYAEERGLDKLAALSVGVAMAKGKSHDDLFDQIWTQAEDQRICDNGGFNAWVCPHGCHTVSFDREENE